jgi:hypothetical protein
MAASWRTHESGPARTVTGVHGSRHNPMAAARPAQAQRAEGVSNTHANPDMPPAPSTWKDFVPAHVRNAVSRINELPTYAEMVADRAAANIVGNWEYVGRMKRYLSLIEARGDTVSTEQLRFRRQSNNPDWTYTALGRPVPAPPARPTMPPRSADAEEWDDHIAIHGVQHLARGLNHIVVDGTTRVDPLTLQGCHAVAVLIPPTVGKDAKRVLYALLPRAIEALANHRAYHNHVKANNIAVPHTGWDLSVYPHPANFTTESFYDHLVSCGVRTSALKVSKPIGAYANLYFNHGCDANEMEVDGQ